MITDEIINNTADDYNLFILLKKNMIKGEIRLPNLSSKNRSLLHKICYNYGLEHFSTGNYKNRTIIIKDPQHTYFTNSNPLHILKSDISTPDYAREYNYIFTNPPNKNLYEDKEEEDENEEEIEEDEIEEEIEEEEIEEEEIEEEEIEEEDTDTYSSDESECSESSNSSTSYQLLQNATISSQINTLRIFSYINLVMNVIIICNL